MEMFPSFYKLYKRNNFTSITQEILAFIKERGPMSTMDLRKNSGLTDKNKKNGFANAVGNLQMAFSVVVVDKGGPPRHTYTWDLTENWIPRELIRGAKLIDKQAAKAKIVAKLLEYHVVSDFEEAETFVRLR
jgi:hypothetical protein